MSRRIGAVRGVFELSWSDRATPRVDRADTAHPLRVPNHLNACPSDCRTKLAADMGCRCLLMVSVVTAARLRRNDHNAKITYFDFQGGPACGCVRGLRIRLMQGVARPDNPGSFNAASQEPMESARRAGTGLT